MEKVVEEFKNNLNFNRILFKTSSTDQSNAVIAKFNNYNVISSFNDFEHQIRSNIFIDVKLNKNYFEGEITSINFIENSYFIYLKSLKKNDFIKLPIYYKNLVESLKIGDVIFAELNLGIIKRLGTSENYKQNFDLISNIPLKKVLEHNIVINHKVSLSDLDYSINNYKQPFLLFYDYKKLLKEYSYINNLIVISNIEKFSIKEISILKKYENFYPLKIVLVGNSNFNCPTFAVSNLCNFIEDKRLENNLFKEKLQELVFNGHKNSKINSLLTITNTEEEFFSLFK